MGGFVYFSFLIVNSIPVEPKLAKKRSQWLFTCAEKCINIPIKIPCLS